MRTARFSAAGTGAMRTRRSSPSNGFGAATSAPFSPTTHISTPGHRFPGALLLGTKQPTLLHQDNAAAADHGAANIERLTCQHLEEQHAYPRPGQ
jgi:hypothetical protein